MTRAGRLGLEVERFEADRRSDAVRGRVRDDFRGGVKGRGGDIHPGRLIVLVLGMILG